MSNPNAKDHALKTESLGAVSVGRTVCLLKKNSIMIRLNIAKAKTILITNIFEYQK